MDRLFLIRAEARELQALLGLLVRILGKLAGLVLVELWSRLPELVPGSPRGWD